MSEHPNQQKCGGSRLSQNGKEPGNRKKREKRLMVVMIILAVIMVAAAAVAVLYTRWVKKPTLPSGPSASASASSNPSRDPNGTESPTGEPDESEEPDYDPVQPKVGGERKSEDFYTILVFGADETSNLTDTMMVVSYDVTNQRATVMSIPRDTIANTRFSGVDAKKMNAVYKFNGRGEKGIEALKKEVSELVGFAPDYYVMIDWELVGQMVDAIRGVWFEVPWDMWYSDPYQDLYIDLKEGYQLLDGSQAMQLVRWRKNMDPVTFKILEEHSVGDVGRLSIQHDFLKAVLKQTLQIKNVTRISELAELFGQNVTSDLTIENLFWFGSQAIMGGLNVDNVEFVTMPYGVGSYPVKSGSEWKNRSFVYPTQKKLLTIINEGLNPFKDDVTLRELDIVYPNSSGGLSATSGKLADSSMAALPEAYLEWKNSQENPEASPDPDEENGPIDPVENGDPSASQEPGVMPDPEESGNPETNPDPGISSDPGAGELPPADPGSEVSYDPEMPEWLLP